jgi:hypothetical protein
MIVKVSVTDKHIKKGQTCSGNACPVALAIRDTGWSFVSVSTRTVRLGSDAYNAPIARLPYNVTRWIGDFDRGQTCYPIEFDLDVREYVHA